MSPSPPVTFLVLTGLAGIALAAAVLFGVQWFCASLLTAFLRRRYPSPSARRAYLLQKTAYYTPTLTDVQRLEKIRDAGRIYAFSSVGMNLLLPSELARRWMRPANPYDWKGHNQLLWVGAGLSLVWVMVFTPWLIAKGKFAREALETPISPPVDPAQIPPTFWPNFKPVPPE